MSYDLATLPTHPVSAPGDPSVRGPAGWHSFDDIYTVVGLLGSFVWNENRFFPSVITFSFIPRPGGGQVQEGTYTIRSGLVVIDQGPFRAFPNNPAIGAAVIFLKPGSPMQRFYVIAGMLTDSNWRIYSMLLNPWVSGNPNPIPGPGSFFATRIA